VLTQPGFYVFIAALGMMAGLLSVDVSQLPTFADAVTPLFVGKMLAHFGVVVAAFIGGKLLPTDPVAGGSRKNDPPPKE
jgi:hypothetical protein